MSTIHEVRDVLCPFDQLPQAMAACVVGIAGDGTGGIRVAWPETLTHGPAVTMAPLEPIPLTWEGAGNGIEVRGSVSALDLGGNFSRLVIAAQAASHASGDALSTATHAAAIGARRLLDRLQTGIEFAFQTGGTILT